jgi:GNAT superfamily N-acetyltransferase
VFDAVLIENRAMKNEKAIRVRQAAAEDLEQLCKIRNNETLFKEYLEDCEGDNAYFLVAEAEAKIVGFGLVYLDVTRKGKKKSHLPKLSDLHVLEDYRRRGVGKTLVEAREALAKQRGYSQIYLSIDPAESPEMMNLARKLNYFAVQTQPYQVTAIYYDSQGQPYEKTYFRLDFRKSLT